MTHDAIVLGRADVESAEVRALIAALDAEITERYPEEGASFFALDAAEVAPGNGAFLIAYVEGRPVGCGGVRSLGGGTGEIKRMFTSPELRGRVVGRALLDALEVEARSLGLTRLLLETGDRQPEAIALYRRAGFEVIPCFGEYADAPLNLCMSKELR